VEEVPANRNTTDYDLGHMICRPLSYKEVSSSAKDEDSSEVDNDEPKVETTKDVGHTQDDIAEVLATDITHSPELTLLSASESATEIDSPLPAGSFHGELQQQLMFAHNPSETLDETTLQSAP
jgi:hypothetical protein